MPFLFHCVPCSNNPILNCCSECSLGFGQRTSKNKKLLTNLYKVYTPSKMFGTHIAHRSSLSVRRHRRASIAKATHRAASRVNGQSVELMMVAAAWKGSATTMTDDGWWLLRCARRKPVAHHPNQTNWGEMPVYETPCFCVKWGDEDERCGIAICVNRILPI